MIKLNKDIIKLESVSSTNNFAKELLVKALPNADITIIDTKEQTKGRGQKGNYWESEINKNATFSFIIKPTFLKAEEQFFLSMAVSLAIIDCLSIFCNAVHIKWPNDIYVSNKKICGILIENSLLGNSIQTAIVGIGLNINQTLFSEWIPNPTSLKQETGKDYDTEYIKSKIIDSFEKYYIALHNKNLEFIHKEYLKHIYLHNIKSTFKDITGIFEGKIKFVNTMGFIEIEKEYTEIKEYTFKEVEYIIEKH